MRASAVPGNGTVINERLYGSATRHHSPDRSHRFRQAPVRLGDTLHLWEKWARKTRNATSGGGGWGVFKQIGAFLPAITPPTKSP